MARDGLGLRNSTAIAGSLFLFFVTIDGSANAAECVPDSTGAITVDVVAPNANVAGCELSSVAAVIGEDTGSDRGILVRAGGSYPTTGVTVVNDLVTTINAQGKNGSTAIAVGSGSPATILSKPFVDAGGKTITVEIIGNDKGTRRGMDITRTGWVDVGTFNLKIHDITSTDEHYGIVIGSTVDSGDSDLLPSDLSKATFDNLTIDLQGGAGQLTGIRAISGGPSAGKGTSGYVEVRDNAIITIDGVGADEAMGLYLSGGESQVHFNNSVITIKGGTSRSNALRLGKSSSVGTGPGKFYSSGNMLIDTTEAGATSPEGRAAILMNWQGSELHADKDTSSTEIRAKAEVIAVMGTNGSDTTVARFNNLVASTASTNANLIEVAEEQKRFELSVRGAESSLTAASEGYLINVAGSVSKPSHVEFSFADGYMKGLTNKSDASTLNIALSRNSMWELAEAGESSTARFSLLDVFDNAVVNASGSADKLASFELKGNVKVRNGGTLALDNGIAGDVLTINGNLEGDKGILTIDTVLGGDSSETDRLVITGDSYGSALLQVRNVGGTGAQTNNGIKVVEVQGNSQAKFTLIGDFERNGEQAIVAGAYLYRLFQGGLTTGDDDWYLRSNLDEFQPGVPVYEAYPQVLLHMNDLPSLHDRTSNRFWGGAGSNQEEQGADSADGGRSLVDAQGVWARIYGSHQKDTPRHSLSHAVFDSDIVGIQTGVDAILSDSVEGTLVGGVNLHYGHATVGVHSDYGNGGIRTNGYGFGGTLTWYSEDGFYADGQAKVSWYNSDLHSTILGTSYDGLKGFGYALSIEAGKRIPYTYSLSFTPQAQLTYSSVDFDGFRDVFGTEVNLQKGKSLRLRAGVSADRENAWRDANGKLNRSHVYGIANIFHEFLDGTQIDVSGADFRFAGERTWVGLGVGGTYTWDDGRYSLFGELSASTSTRNFGDSYKFAGTLGVRMKW